MSITRTYEQAKSPAIGAQSHYKSTTVDLERTVNLFAVVQLSIKPVVPLLVVVISKMIVRISYSGSFCLPSPTMRDWRWCSTNYQISPALKLNPQASTWTFQCPLNTYSFGHHISVTIGVRADKMKRKFNSNMRLTEQDYLSDGQIKNRFSSNHPNNGLGKDDFFPQLNQLSWWKHYFLHRKLMKSSWKAKSPNLWIVVCSRSIISIKAIDSALLRFVFRPFGAKQYFIDQNSLSLRSIIKLKWPVFCMARQAWRKTDINCFAVRLVIYGFQGNSAEFTAADAFCPNENDQINGSLHDHS